MTAFTDPPIAVSSNPIAQKDAAETFAESGVTVTHNQTATQSEAIALGGVTTGNITEIPDYGNTYSRYNVGVEISPNRNLAGVKVLVSTYHGTVWPEARLLDSAGEVLERITGGIDPGDSLTFNHTLASGSSYYVVLDNNGDGNFYNAAVDDSPSFPYTGTDLNVIDGREDDGDDSSRVWGFDYLEGVEAATSGSAIIEFAEPNDIYRWDAATYTVTPDGETVTVNIEADDGTGWTEVATDISRGDDIPAEPGDSVRFRVDIERQDVANNPTIDSLYRRWVV